MNRFSALYPGKMFSSLLCDHGSRRDIRPHKSSSVYLSKPMAEVLKRSNSRKIPCETSCRVRSVPRSFSELREVAVMAWKRSSVRSRSGPPINPLQINSMSRKHSSGRERWVRCMAANLLKAGHEVTVCDLAPDAVRQFNTSETHGHSISAR